MMLSTGGASNVRAKRFFKRATAHLFYRVLNAMSDIPIPRDTGDFRLVSRQSLDAVLAMPERARFIRGMFAWAGFRQVGIEYVRAPRSAGETKYPLRKMIRFAVDAMTAFSTKPLKLATRLSFCQPGRGRADDDLCVPFADRPSDRSGLGMRSCWRSAPSPACSC